MKIFQLLAIVLVACLQSSAFASPPDTSRPNIVIFYTDDQGYGDVSALNPEAKFKTPNMDRLAREGVTFTDGHSSDSVCTPSRYSLLTGRYAFRTSLKKGVLGADGPCLIQDGTETIASLLKKNGYYTNAMFKAGKKSIYEGGHRVPFLMRWPAGVPAGKQVDTAVCQSDIMATVAEIVGVELAEDAGVDSFSLLGAMTKPDYDKNFRGPIIHRSYPGYFSIRDGKWKLDMVLGAASHERFLVTPEPGQAPYELYDLEADPSESRDVYAKHPEVVASLTAKITELIENGRSTPGAPQDFDKGDWKQLTWMSFGESDGEFKPETEVKMDREERRKRRLERVAEATNTDKTSSADKTDQSSKTESEFAADQFATYKTVGETELQLHVFHPEGHKATDRAAVIVLFFGGGWSGGHPQKLYPQCAHFASKGMVAIAADYRVKGRNKTTPRECVKDGKSAIRWIRQHADELGVDPDKLVAGGASAGGHVAAATGTATAFNEPGEADPSCRPDALVLFNPVFDNGPNGYGHDRVSDYWEQLSPMHNIDAKTPPTIVFFGTQDKHVPVATARDYKKRMEDLGLRCDLFLYEDMGHGFFNYRAGDDPKKNKYFNETLREADTFLISLGLIK